MKRLIALLLVVLAFVLVAATVSLQAGQWFSSGIVFATVPAPITLNQVLVDGKHRDDGSPFSETVEVYAAASVTGFVALQLVDDTSAVFKEQPIQIGLGATPQLHFVVDEQPGQHLRIVNKTPLTTGAVAVSLIY